MVTAVDICIFVNCSKRAPPLRLYLRRRYGGAGDGHEPAAALGQQRERVFGGPRGADGVEDHVQETLSKHVLDRMESRHSFMI